MLRRALTRLHALRAALIVFGALGAASGAMAQGVYGGSTNFVVISAASDNTQLVGIVGPHNVTGLTIHNTSAALADVRLYDTATPPVCSSAVGLVANFPMPVVGAAVVPIEPFSLNGVTFQNGVGVCITGATGGFTNTDDTNAPVGVIVDIQEH